MSLERQLANELSKIDNSKIVRLSYDKESLKLQVEENIACLEFYFRMETLS